jgi:hypothetical protein
MPGLASERCFHHQAREAASRCPGCRHFFCRECVVPFDGRLLCAACIAEANESPLTSQKRSSRSGQMLLGMAALIFIWMVFYCLGWIILQYRETQPVDLAENAPSLSESRHCLGQNSSPDLSLSAGVHTRRDEKVLAQLSWYFQSNCAREQADTASFATRRAGVLARHRLPVDSRFQRTRLEGRVGMLFSEPPRESASGFLPFSATPPTGFPRALLRSRVGIQ